MSSHGDRPDDLMTAVDAARILGLSVDMVRLLAKDGRLPFMSTVGGIRLFRRADVDILAARRRAGMANSHGSDIVRKKVAVLVDLDQQRRAKSRGRS